MSRAGFLGATGFSTSDILHNNVSKIPQNALTLGVVIDIQNSLKEDNTPGQTLSGRLLDIVSKLSGICHHHINVKALMSKIRDKRNKASKLRKMKKVEILQEQFH